MPRSLWSGNLGFGPLLAPVKLYVAQDEQKVAFNQLHLHCGSRMKQLRWCPTCDREVEWGEIGKGYEYAKDQTVILTEEDLNSLPLPTLKQIEIKGFLERDQHPDPILYKDSYYVVAQDGGIKPFGLIVTAMQQSGLQALATVTLRQRERQAVLRPMGDGRVLLTLLYYGDEIRDEQTYHLNKRMVQATEREITLTRTLVTQMVLDDFDPNESENEYRKGLLALVNAKIEGKELAQPVKKALPKPDGIAAALEAAIAMSAKKSKPKASKAKKS